MLWVPFPALINVSWRVSGKTALSSAVIHTSLPLSAHAKASFHWPCAPENQILPWEHWSQRKIVLSSESCKNRLLFELGGWDPSSYGESGCDMSVASAKGDLCRVHTARARARRLSDPRAFALGIHP